MANKFFKNNMGHLARMKDGEVNIYYPSGLCVYLLMSILITVFVVNSPQVKTYLDALFYGALLGLGLFVTYDLTNHAILDKYSVDFAVVDILWGTFMCTCVSYISFQAKTLLFSR